MFYLREKGSTLSKGKSLPNRPTPGVPAMAACPATALEGVDRQQLMCEDDQHLAQ
jgi:hypothetical protein